MGRLLSIALTIVLLGGCAGALLTPGSGGQGTPSRSSSSTDSALAIAVRNRISVSGLVEVSSFRVIDRGGYVTLLGVTESVADGNEAAALARSINGVKGVANQLSVRPN